jgi:hypothetical protein
MAIKRSSSNPVVILDAVVTGVERDTFTERNSDGTAGPTVDKGRRLSLQTGAGPSSELLEVRVPLAFEEYAFEYGDHVLMNVEYSEYSFIPKGEQAEKVGSIMRFHSFVTANQFDQWKGLVGQQSKAGQAA